ncbi:MAG: lytic transglycosylase domain-containing protein [Acidobacteria bacterium]|nr:lytic transglycosylase domain-containing protein [Acidobacteriota bacterium]MCI0720212.1 lytic transglycosylase domain-containing protein [Acidobacteriota bacterium]
MRPKFSLWPALVLFFLGFSGGGFSEGHQAQEIIKFASPEGKRIYSNTEEIYRLVKADGVPQKPKLIPLDEKSGPPAQIEKWIQEISEQQGVDPELVKAVAKTESNFNPYAVSHKGALGLMQLIPETAKRFGVTNVFDAKQNIEGGVKFLKFLMGMFPNNLSHILAAYNAGENAVVKYKGIPPYPETQAYVRRITQAYSKKGNFLVASNQPEADQRITTYRDNTGRVVYSNLDSAYR